MLTGKEKLPTAELAGTTSENENTEKKVMREISPEMPVKDTAIFPKKEIDTIAKSRDLSAKKETPIPPKKDSIKPKMPKPKPTEKSLEQSLTDMGLIDIQTIDASIKSDVKYSTTDNFMKADAYGELNKIFLQKEVAEMLEKEEQTS